MRFPSLYLSALFFPVFKYLILLPSLHALFFLSLRVLFFLLFTYVILTSVYMRYSSLSLQFDTSTYVANTIYRSCDGDGKCKNRTVNMSHSLLKQFNIPENRRQFFSVAFFLSTSHVK